MADLNSPILTGDISGGLHSTSVDAIKGSAVAATAPASGQVLTWNGSAWAPATPSTGGGGGANGLTYYLDFGTAADAPTTGLPGTPKMLGRTGSAASSSVTSGTLTINTWTLIAGFASESAPQDPAVLVIPGGLWDFNIWAYGTANINSPTSIRAKVYTYDGANAPTLVSTSSEAIINTASLQFTLSALVPQTSITATTRIYVEVEAQATANNHTATLQFGDGQPSHVHTSLPLVGGTGLWKNVAGVLQSPASLLVDADVDPAAAIAQSKISGLTAALAAKAGTTQVDVYATPGTFTWTKPAGAVSVNVVVISGGGGGASGRKGGAGSAAPGGGGGGGGSYSTRTFSAALLGATETVTVGAGGSGGASVTANATNGNPGTAGTNSSFGGWVIVQGGGGAGIVTTSSGQAGASASARAMFQGGNGGTGGTGAGAGGNNATVGCPGGGSGGGLAATTPTAANGGVGGVALGTFASGGQATGGLAGGGNGGTGSNSFVNTAIAGSAGAGGGSSITVGVNGGNGGNGGFYGAAGGGGGAGLDATNNSGAGGNGAQGIVVVTTYF